MPRSAWAATLLAAAVLAACGGTVSDEHVRTEPYTLEPVEGSDYARVILIPSAVERLGIETVPVGSDGSMLVVPSDAVYLDAKGHFWVYTNPEPLVFVRHDIEVVEETSTVTYLSDGPPVGTLVVTVGVPELYGSEVGFGK